jgi:ribosomal protein S12 methylthiotransferase
MRRETSRSHIEELIGALRSGIPGIALRTTFIVGFPGETQQAFESLLEFMERTRFERLGVFKYSQEDGSRAAKMPEQLPTKIKNERYRRAMIVQQRIARDMAAKKVGRELRLLVDQPLVARTEADAPEVDARVILSEPAIVGEFTRRRITGSRGYDLLA